MFNAPKKVIEREKVKAKYSDAKVIVLDDSFNTFEHVANSLLTIIPDIGEKRPGI